MIKFYIALYLIKLRISLKSPRKVKKVKVQNFKNYITEFLEINESNINSMHDMYKLFERPKIIANKLMKEQTLDERKQYKKEYFRNIILIVVLFLSVFSLMYVKLQVKKPEIRISPKTVEVITTTEGQQ